MSEKWRPGFELNGKHPFSSQMINPAYCGEDRETSPYSSVKSESDKTTIHTADGATIRESTESNRSDKDTQYDERGNVLQSSTDSKRSDKDTRFNDRENKIQPYVECNNPHLKTRPQTNQIHDTRPKRPRTTQQGQTPDRQARQQEARIETPQARQNNSNQDIANNLEDSNGSGADVIYPSGTNASNVNQRSGTGRPDPPPRSQAIGQPRQEVRPEFNRGRAQELARNQDRQNQRARNEKKKPVVYSRVIAIVVAFLLLSGVAALVAWLIMNRPPKPESGCTFSEAEVGSGPDIVCKLVKDDLGNVDHITYTDAQQVMETGRNTTFNNIDIGKSSTYNSSGCTLRLNISDEYVETSTNGCWKTACESRKSIVLEFFDIANNSLKRQIIDVTLKDSKSYFQAHNLCFKSSAGYYTRFIATSWSVCDIFGINFLAFIKGARTSYPMRCLFGDGYPNKEVNCEYDMSMDELKSTDYVEISPNAMVRLENGSHKFNSTQVNFDLCQRHNLVKQGSSISLVCNKLVNVTGVSWIHIVYPIGSPHAVRNLTVTEDVVDWGSVDCPKAMILFKYI